MADAYTQLLHKTGMGFLKEYNLAKNKTISGNSEFIPEEVNPTVFVYFNDKLRILYSDMLGINRNLSTVFRDADVQGNVGFVVYTKNYGSFFRCPVEENDKLNKEGQRAYLDELVRDGLISPDIISGYSGAVVEDPVVAVSSVSAGEKIDTVDKKTDVAQNGKIEQKEKDVFSGITCMICPEKYTHNLLVVGYGGAYIPPKSEDVDYSKIIKVVFGPNHYLVKPLDDNVTVAGKHMENNFDGLISAYNEKIPIIFRSRFL